MEMRAVEDIGIAEDLTPPLPPLAFSLYDSFLYSHCPACTLPLSNAHFTPAPSTNSPPYHHLALRYCSPLCSSLDSPLHHLLRRTLQSQPPTCPPDRDSSHLRLSLRLLRKLYDDAAPLALDRIGGLLTNYEKFLLMTENEEDDDFLGMIKEGARAMAAVLAGKYGGNGEVEEAVMCLVLTNAVEVQDKDGRNVGIGVYDWRFSWINHSCSPNACYLFITVPPSHVVEGESQPRVRIYPATTDGDGGGGGGAGDRKSSEGYGPRIVVRSKKGIKRDEEVTIAYTDLLQPKELRQSELFTKYRFNCCCKRCSAAPLTYVDRSLQKISVCSPDGLNLICESRKATTKKLMDSIDSAIDEYLTLNNPESCCQKLEELLADGFLNEQLKKEPGKSEEFIRLHQLHHLSLNVYTTLASAYRVRASDFLAFNPENRNNQVKAFSMSRISAAYSLLLAVLTHHLFLSETSLIASVANFWKNAGESLVYLSQSSVWNTLWKLPSIAENPSILNHKCYLIVQLDRFEAKSCTSHQDQNVMFGEISRQFLNCIVNLASKLWGFLTPEGHHLDEIKDLVDFRWLLTVEGSLDFETHLACGNTETVSRVEANDEQTNQERKTLLQLAVQCLIYGAYLSSLCFGRDSLLTHEVVNLLRSEGIVAG